MLITTTATKSSIKPALRPYIGLSLNDAEKFIAEREEILRHKWLESEKAGYDIGFDRALLGWIVKHRANWRKARQKPKVA